MSEKEKLKAMLLLDIKRWTEDVLKEALLFVDDKCLEPDGPNDLHWWWDLRKAIRLQLDIKRAALK